MAYALDTIAPLLFACFGAIILANVLRSLITVNTKTGDALRGSDLGGFAWWFLIVQS